jgi:hypothetical protein
MTQNFKINKNLTKIAKLALSIVAVCGLTFTAFGLSNSILNYNNSAKNVGASGPNSGDLIINQVDTGSAIELSVCVKATPGPIHLTNVSTWFEFDNSALTPSATILEKGVYGNSNNGYGPLKWQQVQPAPVLPSTLETYTMRIDFSGDGITVGQTGIAMATSTPELLGKVKFDKISGSTGSSLVNLTKNKYFSTEYPNDNIVQNIISNVGVSSDCRGVVNSISSSSLLPSSSAVSSSLSNSSVVQLSSTNSVSSSLTPNSSSQVQIISSSSQVVSTTNIATSSSSILLNNSVSNQPSVNGSNNGDLIIGTVDNGTNIELSVCVKATPGPLHLTNVSNWFQFDPTALTPSASILEKGVYGNSNNGYGQLKWQQVAGASTSNSDTYSLRLDFSGDGVSVGQTGIAMATSAPELYGKLKFDVINGLGDIAINLIKNKYFTIENPNTEISQAVKYINGDCRATTTQLASSSLINPSVVSSLSSIVNTSSHLSTSSNTLIYSIGLPNIPSGTGLGGVIGGPAPTIPLTGNTYPNGTPATFTLPGTTAPIQGTITSGNFIPNSGQNIPIGSTTGLSTGVLTVNGVNLNVPTNFSPAGSSTIGAPIATPNTPIILVAGGLAPSIPLTGNTYPNGTPATFTLPGSTTPIQGIIINGSFVPNSGQTIPSNGFSGQGVAVLIAGGQVMAIPIKYSSGTSGGVITITNGNNVAPNPTTNGSSNQTNPSTNVTQTATPIPNSIGKVFKSKLRITDPYICGEGSYGNVPNPKEFGVEAVYYDFYKVGSTVPSYSFMLKLASNGDFFLPITKTENPISEGDYRVVFYAFDNESNKAQGEYTDFITTNCSSEKLLNSPLYRSVRTGGYSLITSLMVISLILSSLYFYQKSKTKKKLDYYFENKID